MGYADMLGLFKGYGKGIGPGLSPEEEQGGWQGAARAVGGGMKGIGAGLMSQVPELAQMTQAQDRAQFGAYRDMEMTQRDQDMDADITNQARQAFASNPAHSKYLQGVMPMMPKTLKPGSM